MFFKSVISFLILGVLLSPSLSQNALQLDMEHPLSENVIKDILVEKDKLWIGTDNAGLFHINDSAIILQTLDYFGSHVINCLAGDSSHIWIGTK